MCPHIKIKLMYVAKRFTQANFAALLGMTAFTASQYPEMLTEPAVMLSAL